MNNPENRYKRIEDTKALGIYLGIDYKNRPSMLVKLTKKPRLTYNSEYLIFDCNKRMDDLWALTVSIKDHEYEGVFSKLVFDLAESVRYTNNTTIAERIFIKRFDEWKNLFTIKVESVLAYSQIVGLAGELYFMHKYLIAKYGVSKSIQSWSGPIGADKDFNIERIWFEVKSKSLNKSSIHINSHTQLLSEKEGFLVVISYDKSSFSSTSSFNLLTLYDLITDKISDSLVQKEFDLKLANMDFIPHEKYKDINLEFHQIDFYEVDSQFPQVSVIEEKAINSIEYNLYLPAIKDFKKEI